MKLVNVTEETEDIFFRCMHVEEPGDQQIIDIRRRWYYNYRDRGLVTKFLLNENQQKVGLCQYIPIEHSHLLGHDLMVILCLYVWGYEYNQGNQQGNGYGRFMLDAIEKDVQLSGFKGIVAWGVDWDINWMPISFFEHMGYERIDAEDKVIVLWKPFMKDVEPPQLKRLSKIPQKSNDKVNVTVAVNGWCGCYKALYARAAITGLENMVEYNEIDNIDHATILHLGKVGGIFLDGKVFKPYQMCTVHELREEIVHLYDQKVKKPKSKKSIPAHRGEGRDV